MSQHAQRPRSPYYLVCAAVLLWLSCPTPAFACATVALTFDARAGKWTVDPACQQYVDLDINGRPTVYVKRPVTVSVRITEANPLLYGAHYGVVKVEPIEGLKELQTLFSAAGGLVGLAIQTRSALREPDPLRVALDALIKELRTLEASRELVVRRAQELETAAEVTIPLPTTTLATLDRLFTAVRTALEQSTNPGSLAGEVEKVLAGHARAVKTLASMQLALTPHCVPPGTTCASVRVQKVITLRPIERASAWDQIATYPIKIARTGLFAEDVVTTLPKEIDTQVRVAAPQASLFDAAVGIVNTTVAFRTWSAVADPDAPGQKVITRTAEDRFVAVPALIGTYAFTRANARRASRPMLEFGASLNTKKPAWFVGGGVAVGGLRLGIGGVLARTTALDGQTERTPVADTSAIRTKTVWDGGLYFSFGLSLSSLTLFGG